MWSAVLESSSFRAGMTTIQIHICSLIARSSLLLGGVLFFALCLCIGVTLSSVIASLHLGVKKYFKLFWPSTSLYFFDITLLC